MRAALGVLFLLLLFVAAALVQESWIDGVRQRLPGLRIQPEHESHAGSQELSDESGWTRLVIGRPSGADPVALPTDYSQPEAEREMLIGLEPESVYFEEDIPLPSDFEITLDSSSTLSEVCVRFYGSGAPKLYKRLASYNGFDDPDAIRAGQKLFVPPTRELLFAE